MPDLMRFGQIGPITQGQEHLSLYQYAWNNAVLKSDPNGDCPSCPQGIAYSTISGNHKNLPLHFIEKIFVTFFK